MTIRPFSELRVVTTAGWLARDLAAGAPLPVVHDLGLDVPADTSATAWWMPHQHVERLRGTPAVTAPALSSPGPVWMTGVPAELMRRRVWAGPVADVGSCPLWGPDVLLFAKPAEIKAPRMPANVYGTPGAVTAAAAAAGLAPESMLVVSELVTFAEEFRCFIAPSSAGRASVVAGSAYLVDGVTWDAWEGAAAAPDPGEAMRFAQRVVDAVPGPAGWVLDVGRLDDGSWVVVEANASWSSNPYHCDPAGVVTSILASQTPGQDHESWAWRSDPYMARFARPLPVRSS